MGAGIDYSLGKSNVNHETGIHYGVIHQNEVGQAWYDDAEESYGQPHCPKCGTELPEGVDDGCECPHCKYRIKHVGEECYGDEPNSFFIDNAEFKAECDDRGDIFVFKSPYYTLCAFCSPCAPGAGYLMSPTPEGIKAYCFGHDWFEDGKAPYPVYRVDNNELVELPKK